MKPVNIIVSSGVEGKCLYINNYRVAGPKPWGGGKTVAEFNIDRRKLREALRRKSRTKAQLWRCVARLAGDCIFLPKMRDTCLFFTVKWNGPDDVRRLIDHLISEGMNRQATELEKAFAAWEAAK